MSTIATFSRVSRKSAFLKTQETGSDPFSKRSPFLKLTFEPKARDTLSGEMIKYLEMPRHPPRLTSPKMEVFNAVQPPKWAKITERLKTLNVGKFGDVFGELRIFALFCGGRVEGGVDVVIFPVWKLSDPLVCTPPPGKIITKTIG